MRHHHPHRRAGAGPVGVRAHHQLPQRHDLRAARLVTGPAERLVGLRCISEHVAPGQWDYARQPSRKELAAIRLLALSLEEASVKIRTGPPDDGDSPDAALGLWAGELPLATTWQQPIPDPALPPGIPLPAHINARAGTPADRSTSSMPGWAAVGLPAHSYLVTGGWRCCGGRGFRRSWVSLASVMLLAGDTWDLLSCLGRVPLAS